MGVFDFVKSKCFNSDKKNDISNITPGCVTVNNVLYLGYDEIKDMEKGFIAVDFETTGLSPLTHEIVEYAAVVFENGQIVDSFSELAKPSFPMPHDATKVNGITDKMLKKAASTQEVAQKLYQFVQKYKDYPLVAHNAPFDMKFLIKTWEPLGISMRINVIDTLELARRMRPKQVSYHLAAVARMFNVETAETHRAKADAELCGEIAVRMLREKRFLLEEKKNILTDLELKLAKNIKNILNEADKSTSFLSFSFGTYFTSNCYYDFVKMKTKAKKPYILVSEDCALSLPSERISECPVSEAKNNQKRFLIESPDDIFMIKQFVIESFETAQKSLDELWGLGERYQKLVIEQLSNAIII